MPNKKKLFPERVIIARTDRIGDLTLSIPSFSMARKMFPQAKIYALVRSYGAPIIKGFSFIDEIIEIDKFSEKELRKKIRSLNADVFTALFSDNLILKLAMVSGAKYRIGPLSKPLSWFVYNRGVKQKRSLSVKNEAEYNLDLIREINPEVFGREKITVDKIAYQKENDNTAELFLKENDISRPFILIHPFSGGSAKNLTPDEYIKLINRIARLDGSADIVISSSSADYECAVYIKENSACKAIYSGGDILDLAALIDKCALYIGASTGPSHIAGNLKKNALCIYPIKPGLSPIRWGLFGNNHAEYVSFDKNNPSEDYSSKTFDKVSDDMLDETAAIAVRKLYEK